MIISSRTHSYPPLGRSQDLNARVQTHTPSDSLLLSWLREVLKASEIRCNRCKDSAAHMPLETRFARFSTSARFTTNSDRSPGKRTKMHPEESGGPSRGCLGPERITATDPEFWILEIFGNKSKPERREKPRSNASPLQVTEAQRGKSNSEAPLTDDQHVSRRFQGADDEC